MRSRARARASLLACGLALVACKDEQPKAEDPHSLAALDAEGPPQTADCRSWAELDYDKLEELPAAPHMAAFDQAWRTVAQKHYDPTLACLDWLALRKLFSKRVLEAGEDAGAAYAAINEMLGLLGQSHLHATAPTRSSRARDSGPAVVPIRVRWIPRAPGEARVATVVEEAVDGVPSGIPRGAILTAVGDTSIEGLAEELGAALSAREGRPTELAFTIAQQISVLLSCPEGANKTLSFLDPSAGDAATSAEVPCVLPKGERISLGNLRNLPTTVSWRMIGDPEAAPAESAEPDAPSEDGAAPGEGAPGEAGIGYLAFNYWMLPMTERVRAGVAEMRERGMKALILDLRGNPGGVGMMSIPIARLFTREGTSLGRLQMREFNQEFKVEPNSAAFEGPLLILVDEGTASTSEIFAVGMRDIGRVTIVGAGPSAGMALPSMIETLPDGGLIQYVVGDYHSAKGTAAEGEGVAPDLLATESRRDYAEGRDPVLDAAVALLRERLGDPAETPTPAG